LNAVGGEARQSPDCSYWLSSQRRSSWMLPVASATLVSAAP
jgi:hypothetical protein